MLITGGRPHRPPEVPTLVRSTRTAAALAVLLGLLAAILVGAPAAAAGSVTVGQGDNAPGVAVDAAGTAYIAWDNHNTLQFCRLPRGASACDIAHSIAAPGATSLRAFVAVSGSRVVVVQYRYPLTGADPPAAIWAFTSTSGGASFDAGHSVGTLPLFDAVFGPGDTLSGVTNNQAAFQNGPLDGGSAGAAFANCPAITFTRARSGCSTPRRRWPFSPARATRR